MPRRLPLLNALPDLEGAAIRGEGNTLGRQLLIEERLAARQPVRRLYLRLKAKMAYYIVCPPRSSRTG